MIKDKLQLIPPRLVLITGVAGAGKTSLVKNLAKKIDCICIDKDEIRQQIDHGNPVDQKYIKTHRSSVYKKLYLEIAQAMISNKTIIVDAAFRQEITKPGWEQKYWQLAQKYGYKLKIVRLVLDEWELFKRIKQRNHPRDSEKLKAKNWQEFLKNEPIHVDTMPTDCCLTIVNDNLKEVTNKVIDFSQNNTGVNGLI